MFRLMVMLFAIAVATVKGQEKIAVIALKGATIIDGTGAPPKQNMTLVIEGLSFDRTYTLKGGALNLL